MEKGKDSVMNAFINELFKYTELKNKIDAIEKIKR